MNISICIYATKPINMQVAQWKTLGARTTRLSYGKSFGNSIVYETRSDEQLIAVAITDVFSDALSAVYTFFDPDYSSRSLGTYSVLQQINATRQLNKVHLYLGYYIKDSVKMLYKANFRPIEMLIEGEMGFVQAKRLIGCSKLSTGSR